MLGLAEGRLSMEGWEFKKFLEGKLDKIKETFKIGGSILFAWAIGNWGLVVSPELQTLLGLLSWLVWDIFEYWIKTNPGE